MKLPRSHATLVINSVGGGHSVFGEGVAQGSVCDDDEASHEGDEGGGGGGADAGDGLQRPLGPPEVVGAGHQRGDGSLERLDLADEAGAQGFEIGAHRLGAGGLEAVGAGGALGDEVGAGQHQGLQALADRIGGLPAGQAGVALLGVAGQRAGIERVALAERAEGADERLDLAGVGAVSRDVGGEQGVLVAASGLADDEAGGVQAGGEGGERL